MIESIRNAFALPDLRRRILYTIMILVIYRLVANIPAPGVNLSAWLQFTTGATTGSRFLDVLDLLSGGAVRNFSVMAMGVYPVHHRLDYHPAAHADHPAAGRTGGRRGDRS
jgi:preprotein translocase subunit SecY